MKIGLYGINTGPLSSPEVIKRVAQTAEQAGFESLWTGEHVVLVDPQTPPSPMPPEARAVDTIATLSFLAACTDSIRLGSGIILLPQRNPVVLAKELAGVDVLSNGRLLFGIGVGYIPGEFAAIGVPFNERGARASEHLEAIRALWTQERPSFAGCFTSFSGIQSHPQPIQQPHPPIIVGGQTPAAHRRAIAQANGYYGFGQRVDVAAKTLERLKEVGDAVERPQSLGRLEITMTPPVPVDADVVRQYEELGVDRLVLMATTHAGLGKPPSAAAEDEIIEFIERTATELDLG